MPFALSASILPLTPHNWEEYTFFSIAAMVFKVCGTVIFWRAPVA